MKKIKSVMWSLTNGFLYAPVLFLIYIFTQIIRSTLAVYTTVLLGTIISDVQNILTAQGDSSQILPQLIRYGVLNVIMWLAVEMQWRFRDDYLPLRTSVGASKFLVNISKCIPLRKYDDADFCDQYSRFQSGIHAQHQFLRTWITIGITLYSFVLSCIALAEMHFSFVIILCVFFFIEMISVRSHAKIQDTIRREITPINRLAGYIQSMFFGIYNRDTRLYGLKEHYVKEWTANKRIAYEKDIAGNIKIANTYGILQFLQNGVCPMLIVCIALFLVKGQDLLVGSIYTIWQLARTTLSNSTDTTNTIMNCIAQGKHAEETYNFYCEIRKSAPIRENIQPPAEETASAVHISSLDFSYLPGKKTLHDIHLEVQKGEIIALLGENGSGKSTLIKLLLGMYSPEKGTVQVLGRPADMDSEYVLSHVGVAFQDFCCYPFTLRENVGFGNIPEIKDDKKIIDSLNLAQANTILDKAQTIDRMLGRKIDRSGMELSGGEWQRIALARAHFGSRAILILDEPAAKLDPLAEEKQFARIIQYARERMQTVILVSHRVGFARLADRIIFLKNGEIIESGSHADLMEENGEYKKMFDAQREMYAAKEDDEK